MGLSVSTGIQISDRTTCNTLRFLLLGSETDDIEVGSETQDVFAENKLKKNVEGRGVCNAEIEHRVD